MNHGTEMMNDLLAQAIAAHGGLDRWNEFDKQRDQAASWAPADAPGGRYCLGYATLMVEILKDNARPEAGEVYGAMDMAWAKFVGQIAQAYGK